MAAKVFRCVVMGGALDVRRHLSKYGRGQVRCTYGACGTFPLHAVMDNVFECNRLEIIRILLEHGADPNAAAKNARKRTPLHRAITKGLVKEALLLISLGRGDPAIPDGRGVDGFEHAARLRDPTMLNALIARCGYVEHQRSTLRCRRVAERWRIRRLLVYVARKRYHLPREICAMIVSFNK